MSDVSADRRHPGLVVDHGHPEADRVNERLIFGFWIFLMSDAVIFSLLFATYGVMWDATAGGPTAADVTSLPHAFLETMVLLLSSLTSGFMATAMANQRKPRLVAFWLIITLALGAVFLALEFSELRGLVAEGATPQVSGFLSAFFVLVCTHGLHVTGGLIWGLILLAQIGTRGLDRGVPSRLLRFALYWHFLDIIWIGIFTFVYLAGQA